MSFAVVLRPDAEADLSEAFGWYEEQRQGLGEEFLLSVEAALANIRKDPMSFPVVHGTIRRALLRRFPYGIFCIVAEDTVVVVAVFHAHRDSERWKTRS